jgi:hypothetical protein
MFAIKTVGLVGGEEECELSSIVYQVTLVTGDPFFEPPYDNDNAGVAFAYGSCITTGVIYLARITFTCMGEVVPPPCSTINAVPAPDASTGTIEVVDCADTKLIGRGQWVVINRDETCRWCGEGHPTQESTWGKVKALYN